MMTELVIVGRAEAGAIVWTPVPGIAKVIVWSVDDALALRIAWRSEPRPLSLVLVTTKVGGRKAWENSDVLPFGSVAVAVNTDWPAGAGGRPTVKVPPLPELSVTRTTSPRKVCPWPKPVGSAAALAKNWTVNWV